MKAWQKKKYIQKRDTKNMVKYYEVILEEMKREQKETREALKALSKEIDSLSGKIMQNQKGMQEEMESLNKLMKTLLINSLLDEMEEELGGNGKGGVSQSLCKPSN